MEMHDNTIVFVFENLSDEIKSKNIFFTLYRFFRGRKASIDRTRTKQIAACIIIVTLH